MAEKKYFYAVWRRKSTTAVVKLFPAGSGSFTIIHSGKEEDMNKFFGWAVYLYDNAVAPLKILWETSVNQYDAVIVVKWGWVMGISDAIQLWISRALIEESMEKRSQLKPYWFLQRDQRIKERKKPGLKKARKRPKRSKR